MYRPIAHAIDRVVIRTASAVFKHCPEHQGNLDTALALLDDDDFFGAADIAVERLEFTDERTFNCPSPRPGETPATARIHGRFYRCGEDWREHPVVLALHGWNGESCRRWLFPRLGRGANRRHYSLMDFDLPFHGRRRPHAPDLPRRVARADADFISPDLARTVSAARQAIADTRGLIGWLEQQGCRSIGIWGISLGAWISGLVACHDRRLSSAMLMVPIVRMDRAIAQLPFCAPIRESLAGAAIPFARLNLSNQRPMIPKERLRIVAGRHDVFTSAESVAELWEAWDRPPIDWRPHGHISILFSFPTMRAVLESGGRR